MRSVTEEALYGASDFSTPELTPLVYAMPSVDQMSRPSVKDRLLAHPMTVAIAGLAAASAAWISSPDSYSSYNVAFAAVSTPLAPESTISCNGVPHPVSSPEGVDLTDGVGPLGSADVLVGEWWPQDALERGLRAGTISPDQSAGEVTSSKLRLGKKAASGILNRVSRDPETLSSTVTSSYAVSIMVSGPKSATVTCTKTTTQKHP